MAFSIQTVPSALQELRTLKEFYQRQIADAIDRAVREKPPHAISEEIL